MTRWLTLCVAAVAVVSVTAQTPPAFEVASIRPASEQANQVNVGLRVTGSEIRVAYMSLKDYIGMAYRVRPNQITGPDWLAQQRFDIAAKIPDGGSPAQVPEMLQSLLAARFQLKMHRDSKEFPVYILSVARGGLKIQEAPAVAEPPPDRPQGVNVAATGNGNGVGVDLGGGSSFSFGNNKLEIRKMTMSAVADMLSRFLDRPVLDKTELSARYDMTLDLTSEDYTAMLVRAAVNQGVVLPPQALRALDAAPADPLSAPLQKAGLALDARRAPLDIIVVDSIAKTPTEN